MKTFVALDFETSGLDPKRHAPVQLAVAHFVDGTLEDTKSWVIAPELKNGKPVKEYDVFALKISGTTLKDLNADMTSVNVVAELEQCVKERELTYATVLAWNAPFDFAFYSELLFAAGYYDRIQKAFIQCKPPLAGAWQCGKIFARTKLLSTSYSLDIISATFSMARSTSGEDAKHVALEDAILAGKTFIALQGDVS